MLTTSSNCVCPDCWEVLTLSRSGRSGFCSTHQKWYPLDDDPEAHEEANRLNQKMAKAERKRLAAQRRAARRRRLYIIMLILALLLALVVAYLYFGIPARRYAQAADRLSVKDYHTARVQFQALGDYRDSEAQALLCEGMLALSDDDVDHVLSCWHTLSDTAAPLAETLRVATLSRIMGNAKNEVDPAALLRWLSAYEPLDPTDRIDAQALYRSAHVTLVRQTGIHTFEFADVNADGAAELVVLSEDIQVFAYVMAPDGNAPLALSTALQAEWLTIFGDALADSDIALASRCYIASLAIREDAYTQEQLQSLYLAQSVAFEAEGDFASACEAARNAVELCDTKANFSRYYELCQQQCGAITDLVQAIADWDAFTAREANRIDEYGYRGSSDALAGALRLAYARILANQQSPTCVDYLVDAQRYGVDMRETLSYAMECFTHGATRLALRAMIIDQLTDTPDAQAQQRAVLADEWIGWLEDPMNADLSAAEVLHWLDWADAHSLPLDATKRTALAHSAILRQLDTEALADWSFVDWDHDGTDELLTLTHSGTLTRYLGGESLVPVDTCSTDMPNATMTVEHGDTPFVLLERGEPVEGFAVWTSVQGALHLACRVDGVQDYHRDGSIIRFMATLPGGTADNAEMTYDLRTPDQAPAAQATYDFGEPESLPERVDEALLRYWKARASNSTGTLSHFIADDSTHTTFGATFSVETLDALTASDVPDMLTTQCYATYGNVALYEISYTPKGQSITSFYLAAEKVDDQGYRLLGASRSFADAVGTYISSSPRVEILRPGEVTHAHIELTPRMNVYRVLVPEDRGNLWLWSSNATEVPVTVSLYHVTDLRKAQFVVSFTPNTAPQASDTFFLRAGEYYVTVSAEKGTEVFDYELTLLAIPTGSPSSSALPSFEP